MPKLKTSEAALPDAAQSKAPPAARYSPALGLADASNPDIPSPARTLQQRLIDDLNAEAADDDGRRWAPAATLLFSGGAALGLWGLIAWGIFALR